MELVTLINHEMDQRRTSVVVDTTTEKRGRLEELIEMDLSIPCISKLLGISTRTLFRRMQNRGLSIRETYSNLSDDDLDRLILKSKQTSPNSGW